MSITSASTATALSSRRRGRAHHAEELMPHPSTIKLHINNNASGANFSYPDGQNVASSGTVKLKSTVANTTIKVCTYVGTSKTSIFEEGDPPYDATTTGNGIEYTLKSTICGTVTFAVLTTGTSCPNTPPSQPLLGQNGTINVGGGLGDGE
jgi:hypothetical protein